MAEKQFGSQIHLPSLNGGGIKDIAQLRQICDSNIYRRSVKTFMESDQSFLANELFPSYKVDLAAEKLSGITGVRTPDGSVMGQNMGVGQEALVKAIEILYSVEDYGLWYDVDLSRIEESPIMENNQQMIFSLLRHGLDFERGTQMLELLLSKPARRESITAKLNDPSRNPLFILMEYTKKVALRPNRMVMSNATLASLEVHPWILDILKAESVETRSWLEKKLGVTIITPKIDSDHFLDEEEAIGNRIFLMRSEPKISDKTFGLVFDQDIPLINTPEAFGFKSTPLFIHRFQYLPLYGHNGGIRYKTSRAYQAQILDEKLFFVMEDVTDPSFDGSLITGNGGGVMASSAVMGVPDPALVDAMTKMAESSQQLAQTTEGMKAATESVSKAIEELQSTATDKPTSTTKSTKDK